MQPTEQNQFMRTAIVVEGSQCRRAVLLSVLLCMVHPVWAQSDACTMELPPQEARQVARTKFYRIVAFPQWIAADFAGCQRNWVMYYGEEPSLSPRIDTYFERGEIVRVVLYSQGPVPTVEVNCYYEEGYLVKSPHLGAALCPSAKEIADETKKMRQR